MDPFSISRSTLSTAIREPNRMVSPLAVIAIFFIIAALA
jgi:hypothetical protein